MARPARVILFVKEMQPMWMRAFRSILLALLLLQSAPVSAAPSVGSYLYTRMSIAGLEEATVVAFHPDGSYAVVLERSNRVQIIDWASRTAVTHDLTPTSGNLFWEDLYFDPAGSFAWLVGYHADISTEGVIVRLDDGQLRGGGSTAQIFSELGAVREVGLFTAIEAPWGGGLPVLLSRNAAGNVIILREVDPNTGDFGAFVVATSTSAGCDDLAFVDNEFGEFGILVVCGTNGGESHYYTEIGGIGEWRTNSGNASPGNIPVAAAHPGGDYALVVSFSGRRILRYESGAMNSTASAPWFPTQGIFHAAFAPDGVRALIVGRAGGTPLAASILEFRHDLYSLAEITDVSIPSFDLPPYQGTGNTWLLGSAWRPGCDEGLVVGGETGVGGSTGQVIEFALVGGVSCASNMSVPTLTHPLGLGLAFLVALFALAAFRRTGMVRA